MSKLIILGSSNAVATHQADNTHMVVVGRERIVLIDAVSSPLVRLEQAGVDFHDLTDVITTHFHPDHISGIPLLLMDMWLLGRKQPINIFGLGHTLDRIETMLGLYNWTEWPNFFPVEFFRLPAQELSLVLDCPDFVIRSSPVRHMIPTIGLRIEFKDSGKIMAYSCDTEPCDEVVRLSEGADILIHEATGESFGHSSARQAGEIASRAAVSRLYLIHYTTVKPSRVDLIAEAGETFDGPVRLARDFMILDFKNRMPLSHFGRGGRSTSPRRPRGTSPTEP